VLVERLCAGNSIKPNIVYESDSIRSTKGIVELGLGCTVFSRSSLANELDEGRLQAIPFTSALMSWTLCLAHPRRENISLAVMNVKRIILQQVSELCKQDFWPGGREHRD
jgi:DNA-binding transcriptional LysR family regulator